jgi:hypothetical protein
VKIKSPRSHVGRKAEASLNTMAHSASRMSQASLKSPTSKPGTQGCKYWLA